MNWILARLSQQHTRLTEVRQKVAELLIKQHVCTFKAQDIIDKLPKLNRVSVYRTVDLFEQMDIIHPSVTINGSQYYELHEQSPHHHHSFCSHCGSSMCIDCPISKQEKQHHVLSYSHICTQCT